MSNLKNKLLESSQKMKWHTPDGWEVQELIPVEYVLEIVDRYAAEREREARIDELHVIAPLLGLKGDVNADHTLTKGDCWDVLVTRKRELAALKETTK